MTTTTTDVDTSINALNHIAYHADMPANVVAAYARVRAEIGGIAKLTQAQRKALGQQVGDQGVSYAFRGIDAICAEAQPLLGKYGVVEVPYVVEVDQVEITVNGKPWSDTKVTVDWQCYGPGGLQDVIVARTIGEGRDNSDKGINKAMTTAYKNLLLRMLCIGDRKDDTDQYEPAERSTAPPAPAVDGPVSAKYVADVQEALARRGGSLEDMAVIVLRATAHRKEPAQPTSKIEELLESETPNFRAAYDDWKRELPPFGQSDRVQREEAAATLGLEQ